VSTTPLAVDRPALEPDYGTPLEAWDNEGGRLTSHTDLPNVSEAKLVEDFIEGRVGNHHNTYAHRLRCLREDSAAAGSFVRRQLAVPEPQIVTRPL